MIGTANTGGSKVQDQLFGAGKSSRDKYVELVVGRPGLGALVKYEIVVLLSQAVPGALGLLLRKMLYPSLLGSRSGPLHVLRPRVRARCLRLLPLDPPG